MDLEAIKIRRTGSTNYWYRDQAQTDFNDLIAEVEKLKAENVRLERDLMRYRLAGEEEVITSNTLREALEDAIVTVQNGRIASMGGVRDTYIPQISVKQVERWDKALKGGE